MSDFSAFHVVNGFQSFTDLCFNLHRSFDPGRWGEHMATAFASCATRFGR